MATHDYVIANGTGAAVRSDLNDALAAIVSNNSGSSEPATTYAYQWWADTTNNLLKLRNSANNAWITLRELDGTMLMEDGSNSAPGLSFASDTNTGFFSGGADKIGFATGGVERLEIGSSEVVFNDPSNDVDFRVESNGQTHMLFVDAGNDRIGIGKSSPRSAFELGIGHIVLPASGRIGTGGSGDTPETAFRFTSADNISAIVGNNEKLRIDNDGRLLLGTSTVRGGFDNNSVVKSDLQVEGVGSAASANRTAISIVNNGSADADSAGLYLARSGGTSVGSFTAVTANDVLARITFSGADGSEFVQAASIEGVIDGTPGGNDMPGSLRFSTTADGASSSTERARINSSGSLLIGSSVAASAGDAQYAYLQIAGNTAGASGSVLALKRGEAASAMSDDDSLGTLIFTGTTGGDFASIRGSVDGSPSGSDFPGRIVFSTTADGASSPTERLRINSSGNVGVGVTDPEAKLEVKGVGDITGTPYEYIYSTDGGIKVTGNESAIDIVSTDAGNHAGTLIIRGANKGYAFSHDSDDDLFRLTSFTASANNWSVHEPNGSNVSSHVRLASFRKTGGMCFGTDTAAANALDDYEEGQWTPTLKFGGSSTGISYGTNTGGSYVKIGRMVFIHCRIELTSKGSSTGAAAIHGLPFTQGDIQSGGSGVEAVTHLGGYQQNVFSTTLTNVSVGGTIGENSQSISLRFLRYDTGDHADVNQGHFENASSFAMDFIIQT